MNKITQNKNKTETNKRNVTMLNGKNKKITRYMAIKKTTKTKNTIKQDE